MFDPRTPCLASSLVRPQPRRRRLPSGAPRRDVRRDVAGRSAAGALRRESSTSMMTGTEIRTCVALFADEARTGTGFRLTHAVGVRLFVSADCTGSVLRPQDDLVALTRATTRRATCSTAHGQLLDRTRGTRSTWKARARRPAARSSDPAFDHDRSGGECPGGVVPHSPPSLSLPRRCRQLSSADSRKRLEQGRRTAGLQTAIYAGRS